MRACAKACDSWRQGKPRKFPERAHQAPLRQGVPEKCAKACREMVEMIGKESAAK